jgi:hypothetical protein
LGSVAHSDIISSCIGWPGPEDVLNFPSMAGVASKAMLQRMVLMSFAMSLLTRRSSRFMEPRYTASSLTMAGESPHVKLKSDACCANLSSPSALALAMSCCKPSAGRAAKSLTLFGSPAKHAAVVLELT